MSTFEVKIQTEIDALNLDTSAKGRAYFNDTNGSIVAWDGSNWRAYASDGITFGSTSYVAQLDGNDDCLTLGDVSGTLGGATKCTISWWMKKPNTTNTFAWITMGDYSDAASGSENLIFLWDNVNTRWFIGVGDGSGTGYAQVYATTDSILDNTWYLWTLVFDGTQSTELDRVKMYKNTALLTRTKSSRAIPTALQNQVGTDPVVGAVFNGTAFGNHTDASFDDFAIFEDALTSTQIANIYNNQIYPSSSLKHLYRMENNADDSVGSAHGTQVNSPITNSPSNPKFPY